MEPTKKQRLRAWWQESLQNIRRGKWWLLFVPFVLWFVSMTKLNTPESKTLPIAESENQGSIRMWPSEDWASRLYDLANWGLIVGLIMGVVSTVVVVWMGNVKEAYLRKDLASTNERAAKAELEVQKLRSIAAPRWVEEKPFLEALKDQPKPAGVLIVFAEDNESRRLASQIMGLLFQAGWHVYFPTPIVRAKYSATYLSSAETLGGQPSGLTIVAKDKEGWHVPPFNHNTPYDAIWNAFIKAHYPALYAGRDDTLPDSVLRIVVGSKESPLVP